MILEIENKPEIKTPKPKDIERALKGLKSEGPSSFASLTSGSGDYVQVAGGKFTCFLEKRDSTSGAHYRAYSKKPSAPFPDGSILSFSGGDVALKHDEWLNIERVISVFIAFLEGDDFPSDIHWREIDLN
tara:strand:+ start:1448 stop:1837 length:390 start_codon:yes stop_codon:yes gene_type:complete